MSHLSVILIASLLTSVVARCAHFYRIDYSYFKEFDAFYKIHLDPDGNTFSEAFTTCQSEGAKLFYPKVAGEWSVAKNLMESTNNATVYAIVGTSGFYGLNDYISEDGTPTQIQMNLTTDANEGSKECVLINMETEKYIIEPCSKTGGKLLAFICKKVIADHCPTSDQGYKYNKTAGKCYKVNNKARSWPEAWRTCIMEGGSLAVVTDSAQANVLRELIPASHEYSVGFTKMNNFYYSIKGNLIDDEYELPWYHQNYENCGALYVTEDMPVEIESSENDGRYGAPYQQMQVNDGRIRPSERVPRRSLFKTTLDCEREIPFICEMELK